MDAHGKRQSSEYYTPAWILDIVRQLMGGIDLDPCSCEQAQKTVRATQYYTRKDNGLEQDWQGRVFVNPPGGYDRKTQRFWQRTFDMWYADRIEQACFLSFSLDTLQTCQSRSPGGLTKFPTWIPGKRIIYLDRNSKPYESGMRPSCLTYLAPKTDTTALQRLQNAVKNVPGTIVRSV